MAGTPGNSCGSEKGDIAKNDSIGLAIDQDTDRIDYEARDDPGLWAIAHHENGLINGIEKKKRSKLFDFFGMWKQKKKIENEDEPDNRWKRLDEDNDFRISFAELERMHLRKLQCKLVKHDYDYMVNFTGERKIDSFVINSILGDVLQGDSGPPIPVDGPWEDDNQPIGGTRNDNVTKSWAKGFRERIVIAAVAGLFLIGPMWLMVLHNTLYTSLGSTTGFVAAFGMVMAWFLEKPKEVMSGTAAYAAVLVVFVGLAH
ncbi:hypothetical protein F4677DRAFT_456589 [Hypoxylon crocopeplum]|nr:hypothetical protein F4677DRAFT_456589 [Hypoxylon crocopeplum]